MERGAKDCLERKFNIKSQIKVKINKMLKNKYNCVIVYLYFVYNIIFIIYKVF
jgi:hypothetical protein